MTTESFNALFQRAADRKGGEPTLEALLGKRLLGKKISG
jgi:hypothetical protein